MVIFDTNVFIFAKNQFYHPGFCQGFWDVLDILYEKQEWCSLNFVYNELVKTRNKNNILQMQDYVAIWATARKEYFKIFDANIELRQIQDYLINN